MSCNFTWGDTNHKSYDGPGQSQVSESWSLQIIMIPRAIDIDEMAEDRTTLQNNRNKKTGCYKILIMKNFMFLGTDNFWEKWSEKFSRQLIVPKNVKMKCFYENC